MACSNRTMNMTATGGLSRKVRAKITFVNNILAATSNFSSVGDTIVEGEVCAPLATVHVGVVRRGLNHYHMVVNYSNKIY